MTEKDARDDAEIDLLIVRLLKAAGRVERRMYGRLISAEEIRFHIDWCDALMTLAERLNTRRPRAPRPRDE